jgi:glycerol-3-phosphate O-acyltransferase/dihydroxyacetone phosphate acyltransferase
VWLLPLFPWISRAAAFVYYRVTYAGEPIPHTGPALLVANHPNSLFDPVLVAAAARRPIRFLAKAPLFSDRKVGWLVRGSGAIPVYRQADDPAQMSRNTDMFRAVYAQLAAGAGVALFPEGLSHNDPALAPLKTGAARIALGAHALTGRAFPIVPVGLVFRQKDVFRSEALVLGGPWITWEDLASHDPEDPDAVRALTERIADALRGVTVNLERWADRPLVECAVRIWEAEHAVPPDLAARVSRLDATVRMLADVRHRAHAEGSALAREVLAHCRRLRRLGLRPADLIADVGLRRGVAWAAGRIHLVFPVAAVLAALGFALFLVPYQITGTIVDRMRPDEDTRATHKLLVGSATYGLWIALLVALAFGLFGAGAGVGILLGVPLIGMVGLTVRERWRGAWQDVRRFLLLRSRRDLVAALRARQRMLGERLDRLVHDFLERGTIP